MNTYTYAYYGWIPGYDDFDMDWIDVKSSSIEEANEEVRKSPHLKFVKNGPQLVAINGQDIKELTIIISHSKQD